MLASVQEHDQMHLGLDLSVIVIKEAVNRILELSKIINLFINTDLLFNSFHEVSINKTVRVHNLLLLQVELLL
jgi:hypothetical protein